MKYVAILVAAYTGARLSEILNLKVKFVETREGVLFVDLSGKVAIITGSGQGIGESIAKVFAQNGALVVVATRSLENGEATVKDIKNSGGEATLVQCDVGKSENVNDMVNKTIAIVLLTISLTFSLFPTSHCTRVASPPEFLISFTVASPFSRLLVATTTKAPFCAKTLAILSPIPCPEPVMIATLPDKSTNKTPSLVSTNFTLRFNISLSLAPV